MASGLTMEIGSTPIPGLLVFTPTPHRDARGLFTRTFDAALAAEHGVDLGTHSQDSQSRSEPGVLRGMHGRLGAGESKLVRVSRGAVLDVVVDARPGSAHFGEHFAIELDDESFRALWVPAGFLHGFQVLSTEPADVCYRIDRPHRPGQDCAVRFDDPQLELPWRTLAPGPILAERDLTAPSWHDLVALLNDR